MGKGERGEATAGKLPSTREGELELVVLVERYIQGLMVVDHKRGKIPLHLSPRQPVLD